MEDKITVGEIWDDIYDYSSRWYLLEEVFKLFNFTGDEEKILHFLVAGNVSEKTDMPDVLKKIKLPVGDIKFNKEKVKRWAKYLRKQMEDFDNFGVLRMDKAEILKMSLNGKYLTVATAKINVLVYQRIYELLDENPEYFLQILYGVWKSLGLIIQFLDMEEKPHS